MPQDAIIRADGTGDYTTPQAWEAAEQNQNYGAPTRGLVDGFFDFGASDLVLGGTTAFPLGSILECFDSNDGFDGTERQLCGFTTTNSRTIRINTNSTAQFIGLELYCTNTGTTSNPLSSNLSGSHQATNCLIHTLGRKLTDPNITHTNTVLVSELVDTGFQLNPGTNTFINASIFITNSVRAPSTNQPANSLLFTNVFAHNYSTGGCFSPNAGVSQTNCGSTDGTANAFPNETLVANFVNSNPVVSGDYRILSGSTLATNNIGAFIQSASGVTAEVTESLTGFAEDSTVNIDYNVSLSVTETLNSFTESSIVNISTPLTVEVDVTETLNSFEESSLINVKTIQKVEADVTETLSSFTEQINATIAVKIEVTEVLNSFGESSSVKLPTNWVVKPPVSSDWEIKAETSTNWTIKG